VVIRAVETDLAESAVIAPEDIIAPAPRARVVPTAFTPATNLIAPTTAPQAKPSETVAAPVTETKKA
jgi:hypothetical protein